MCAVEGCGHCLPFRTGCATWKARAGYWSKEQYPERSKRAPRGLSCLSRSGRSCPSGCRLMGRVQSSREAWCLWLCVVVQGMAKADKEMLLEAELELVMLGAEEVHSWNSGGW